MQTEAMVVEREYFVGLDVGQKRDHTAIAVVERARLRTGGFDHVTWTHEERERWSLRHVERLALGTSYLAVVERVRKLIGALSAEGACTLVVDETGVGGPVVDLLREAGLRCMLVPVTITGGDRARRVSGGRWMTPKRDLAAGLQVMLERGELRIAPGLRDGALLMEELRQMRIRVGAEGREKYGASGAGSHDDLVLALALACWRGWVMKPQPVWGTKRLL